jgi:8-oxo-dGTP diphosphatase
LYLVRHAEAGVRTDRADDHLRPLSGAGRHQARLLTTLFESVDVGDILSSPYVRCVQTLEPLADRRGRTVVHTDTLAEGAPIDAVLDLLHQVPARTVLCTHGDVMEAVLQHVVFADTTGCANRLAKGVVWVLERSGDRVSVVQMLAAPVVCPTNADKHMESPDSRRALQPHSNTRAVAGVAR